VELNNQKLQTLDSIINNFFGDFQGITPKDFTGDADWPFILRCSVIKASPPRHERFEYIRELGSAHIQDILDEKEIHMKDLVLIFLERWMSVHEQQAFTNHLFKNPGKIERVTVVTSSPLIVGRCPNGTLLSTEFPDDEKYNEGNYKVFG